MSQGMVAFLAGLGGGLLQAQDKRRKQALEDEDRAERKEDRAYLKGERDRTIAIRNRLGDAAAPVTMESVMTKPDTADNRDVGTPGTDLVDTGAKRVGQQTFAPDQQEQAQAALAEANKPGAATLRMADVLARSGDPVAAQNLRAGARQEKLGELQLDEAQRAALNRQYDEALNAAVNSWADLPSFVNDAKHDGQGGNLKIQTQPTADGKKMQILKLNADGSTTPTSLSFSNDATGLMQAKAFISKGLSASDKLQHLHQQATIDRADAAQQETVRHNKEVERITGMRAATAAAGAAQPAPIWDKGADDFLKSRYTVKDPDTQAVTVDGAGMQFAKTVALGVSRSNGGDTTTALGKAFEVDQRIQARARELTKDRPKEFAKEVASLRAKYMTAVTGGGAASKDDPLAEDAPPKLPPPPATPPQPGVLDRVRSAAGRAINGMQAAGARYQAIDARVREAGAGGPPLTAQEIATARQFGLPI